MYSNSTALNSSKSELHFFISQIPIASLPQSPTPRAALAFTPPQQQQLKMNALKFLALSLAVATTAVAAQNTTLTGVSESLDNVSLRELVNQAKAAVASNPDLAALFATIGDVNALSDADLAKLVQQILAVTNDGSSSGSGLGKLNNTISNSTTNAPAPAASTPAPIVRPTGGAASLALAPAAVVTLIISVVYTLL